METMPGMRDSKMPRSREIFSQVQPQRISNLIESQIKRAILEHNYNAGDRIPPERELAEMFAASRTSVREALRVLERSGFLKIRKGVQGGAYVAEGSSTHIVQSMVEMFEFRQISLEEILYARLIIEPALAAEAALKATPEDVESLRQANKTLREGYKTGDPAIENVPNSHRIISQISGNRVIWMIMDVLMDVHTARMSNIKLDDDAKEQILAEHEKIIEAIRKKDQKTAFERMRRHILNVHEIHMRMEKQGRSASHLSPAEGHDLSEKSGESGRTSVGRKRIGGRKAALERANKRTANSRRETK